jgi:hypothetical protein
VKVKGKRRQNQFCPSKSAGSACIAQYKRAIFAALIAAYLIYKTIRPNIADDLVVFAMDLTVRVYEARQETIGSRLHSTFLSAYRIACVSYYDDDAQHVTG